MNAIIAQCGGPTAVVNTTLASVIAGWQAGPAGGRIWGSRFGLQGLATGAWADLDKLTAANLAQLADQPAAALGSSRYRPPDDAFPAIVARLRRAQIRTVFLIGGNGTMAAGQSLLDAAQEGEPAIQVIGIPKTIDNDLASTDVAPGFGSTARYVAQTTLDSGLDLRAMRGFDQVAIMEVMGRHAGWVAAAAALARYSEDDPPHLILIPESPVDEDRLLDRIASIQQRLGICFIVAAEGARDSHGRHLAELLGSAGQDPSGQHVFSMSAGVAPYLAQHIQEQLGLRCRQLRLNTAQRSSRALVSPVDRALADQVGTAAVAAAREHRSGVMISLQAEGDGWSTGLVPMAAVIGRERLLPPGFVDERAFDVTPACVDYIRTVAGTLPPAPILWTENYDEHITLSG